MERSGQIHSLHWKYNQLCNRIGSEGSIMTSFSRFKNLGKFPSFPRVNKEGEESRHVKAGHNFQVGMLHRQLRLPA